MRASTALAIWSALATPLAMGHPALEERATPTTTTTPNLASPTTTTTPNLASPTTTTTPRPASPTPNPLCGSSYQCNKPTVTASPKTFELTRKTCGESPETGTYTLHSSTTFSGAVSACDAIQRCAQAAASQAQPDFLVYIGPFDSSPRWTCNTGTYNRAAKYLRNSSTGQSYQYNGKA